MAWNCNYARKIRVDASTNHHKQSIDGTKTYRITATLTEVTPTSPHEAVLAIVFSTGWDRPDDAVSLGSWKYASYMDPDGIEWQVHVQGLFLDSAPPPNRTSADVQICYGDRPAKGEIISTDIPASASEGEIIDLCATIKNVGGVRALFFLRFYDGATMLYETNTRWLEPDGEEKICAAFTMPGHEWDGKIELMRQGV